jgi:nucleoside-diphosphate-sugar epimerase
MGFWSNRKVLVTGGASFIGSNLVAQLAEAGASITVADNLSSGKISSIQHLIDAGSVDFRLGDLRDSDLTASAMKNQEVVFHLAADHGGRGYVELHQAGPASNFLLDGLVFFEALKANVEKVVFASSGCVYPNHLQMDPEQEVFLTEDLIKPPYNADNMYGWAKLMAEDTLRAYHQEHGLQAASCRYFTAYGPHGLESHAVMAMIARTFVRQNPFELWGDGSQIRNWTYVDDIVRGTMLAGEYVNDGTGINIGTMERTSVIEAAREILDYTGHKAEIKFLTDMPTGPLNRVADNSLAKSLMGWSPQVSFVDGIQKTIDWYYQTKGQDDVEHALATALTER